MKATSNRQLSYVTMLSSTTGVGDGGGGGGDGNGNTNSFLHMELDPHGFRRHVLPGKALRRENPGIKRADIGVNCVFNIRVSDENDRGSGSGSVGNGTVVVNTSDNTVTLHAEWLDNTNLERTEIEVDLRRAKLKLMQAIRAPHFGEAETSKQDRDLELVSFTATGNGATDLTARKAPQMKLSSIDLLSEQLPDATELTKKSTDNTFAVLASPEVLREKRYLVEEQAQGALLTTLQCMLFGHLVESRIFSVLLGGDDDDDDDDDQEWWRVLFSDFTMESKVIQAHLNRALLLDPRENVWQTLNNANTGFIAVLTDAPSPRGLQYLSLLNEASVTALLLYKTVRFFLIPNLRANDVETDAFLRNVLLDAGLDFRPDETLWNQTTGQLDVSPLIKKTITDFLYVALYTAMDENTRTTMRLKMEELFVQAYAGDHSKKGGKEEFPWSSFGTKPRPMEAFYPLTMLLDVVYTRLPRVLGGDRLDEWLRS